jgi:hypothetical protein
MSSMPPGYPVPADTGDTGVDRDRDHAGGGDWATLDSGDDLGDDTDDREIFGRSGAQLFLGDTGTLTPEERVCLWALKKRPFITAEDQPAAWETLLAHEDQIRSRLHDEFMDVDIDRTNLVARKRPVRDDDILLPGRKTKGLPTLLYTRALDQYDTIVAVYLRKTMRAADISGDSHAYFSYTDLEDYALALLAHNIADLATFKQSLHKAALANGSFGRNFLTATNQPDRYLIRRAIATYLDAVTLERLLGELHRQTTAREDGHSITDIQAAGPRESAELAVLSEDADQLPFDNPDLLANLPDNLATAPTTGDQADSAGNGGADTGSDGGDTGDVSEAGSDAGSPQHWSL